jgi:hypothetical protein
MKVPPKPKPFFFGETPDRLRTYIALHHGIVINYGDVLNSSNDA